MLVIVEGQARTGKTTVVRELIHRFRKAEIQARPFKSSIRSSNPAEAIITQLLPLCFDDTIWICDRAHITESVYNTLNDRETPYDPILISHIDAIMAASGALLFHLVADHDILVKRMVETDRESEGDIEKISYIFYLYISKSAITKRRIDTGKFSVDETADQIFSAISWMTTGGEDNEYGLY